MESIHVVFIVAAAVMLFMAAMTFLLPTQKTVEAAAGGAVFTACCTAFINPVSSLCSTPGSSENYECTGVPKEVSSTEKIKIRDLYRIYKNLKATDAVTDEDIKGKNGCDCPQQG